MSESLAQPLDRLQNLSKEGFTDKEKELGLPDNRLPSTPHSGAVGGGGPVKKERIKRRMTAVSIVEGMGGVLQQIVDAPRQ